MQEREAAGILRDTVAIRTPFYVVDEALLKKNLEILKDTAERQRAGSMRHGLEKQSLAGRRMYFQLHTARMSSMRF